ncbi:MAG: hypothetical protein NXI35_32805 [bacterium]|nr:hypothetical protein [bacterium]
MRVVSVRSTQAWAGLRPTKLAWAAGLVVALAQPREQPDLHGVQRVLLAHYAQAALAHRSPEPLHLPASLRVVRTCVHEVDAESTAGGVQDIAAVGAAVVEIQPLRRSVEAERLEHQLEHRRLPLVVEDAQRQDVAGLVVEQRVDPKRDPAVAEDERWAVADVGVPQLADVTGFPPATLAMRTVRLRLGQPWESVVSVEAAQGLSGEAAAFETAIEEQRLEDDVGGHRRMLAADLQQEFALGLAQGLSVPDSPRRRPESVETAFQVAQAPAEHRRHGERSGRRTPRRSEPSLRENAKLSEEFATLKLTVEDGAEDLHAEQRDLFRVVLGT